MTELVPSDDVPEDEDALLSYLVDLVERGRRVAAVQVNATLTMTYWLVGRAISVNMLRDGRAEYGQQIVATLSQQLKDQFGSGFDRTNVTRMVTFARAFPDQAEVAALVERLSWSHVRELLTIKADEARHFYAKEAASKHLSVRELRAAIARKAYERREIANSQIPAGSAVPRDTFRDPLILDTLGLHDTYLEKGLEAAILRDVQTFLLEVGRGFAFVASQKRMAIGNYDFYLDLLFFSRPLRRLVAVELLEMHKDGIVVAEYWTALPPKAELQAKLGEIVRDAQERLARRGVAAGQADAADD